MDPVVTDGYIEWGCSIKGGWASWSTASFHWHAGCVTNGLLVLVGDSGKFAKERVGFIWLCSGGLGVTGLGTLLRTQCPPGIHKKHPVVWGRRMTSSRAQTQTCGLPQIISGSHSEH